MTQVQSTRDTKIEKIRVATSCCEGRIGRSLNQTTTRGLPNQLETVSVPKLQHSMSVSSKYRDVYEYGERVTVVELDVSGHLVWRKSLYSTSSDPLNVIR